MHLYRYSLSTPYIYNQGWLYTSSHVCPIYARCMYVYSLLTTVIYGWWVYLYRGFCRPKSCQVWIEYQPHIYVGGWLALHLHSVTCAPFYWPPPPYCSLRKWGGSFRSWCLLGNPSPAQLHKRKWGGSFCTVVGGRYPTLSTIESIPTQRVTIIILRRIMILRRRR